jgi:hypothetical protein
MAGSKTTLTGTISDHMRMQGGFPAYLFFVTEMEVASSKLHSQESNEMTGAWYILTAS